MGASLKASVGQRPGVVWSGQENNPFRSFTTGSLRIAEFIACQNPFVADFNVLHLSAAAEPSSHSIGQMKSGKLAITTEKKPA